MIAISLGWGVQSFALAAMSALGELPKADVAIHADTGWERSETIEFAERWTPWLEEHGVPVVTVHDSSNDVNIVTNPRGCVFIPAHAVFAKDGVWTGKNGKKRFHRKGDKAGMLRRMCTHKWKIKPMQKWARNHIEKDEVVQKWIGISRDEAGRARPSRVGYIENVHPFLRMFDPPMSRGDIIHWLVSHGLEVPKKSSCIICPFHNRRMWHDIKVSGNGDWDRAIMIDSLIRLRRPGMFCYLADDMKPLDECDFSIPEDHGQLRLEDLE